MPTMYRRYRTKLRNKNKLPERQPSADELVANASRFAKKVKEAFDEKANFLRDVSYHAITNCNGNTAVAMCDFITNPILRSRIMAERNAKAKQAKRSGNSPRE